MKRTTFIRRGTRQHPLPGGTKPSVHTGQLLVSSGLHDLDVILGGGFPLGSLICIHEDTYSQYNLNLLKYFISEGLVHHHTLIPICSNLSRDQFINNLPFNYTLKSNEMTVIDEKEDAEEAAKHLKIAWRYKDYVKEQIAMKQEKSINRNERKKSTGTVMCHEYDLSKPVQEELLKDNESRINFINLLSDEFEKGNLYEILFKKIQKIIQEANQKIKNEKNNESIIRISIQSLGFLNDDKKSLLKFLHALKYLIKTSLCVCVITVPKALLDDSTIVSIEHTSDIVMDLDSFTGLGYHKDHQFSDFTGVLTLKKLPKMNSLTYNYAPDSLKYTFKIKRRKMYIEKMYLPPEVSREADRPNRPKYTGEESKITNKDLEF